MTFIYFFFFCGSFLPSWIRIRIHWPDADLIKSGSATPGINDCVCGQVLECRVCEDVYSLHGDKIPRLLFCGHTLCHACLSRLPTLDGFISVKILIILNPALFFGNHNKKKRKY
jgi:hypothetical protein